MHNLKMLIKDLFKPCNTTHPNEQTTWPLTKTLSNFQKRQNNSSFDNSQWRSSESNEDLKFLKEHGSHLESVFLRTVILSYQASPKLNPTQNPTQPCPMYMRFLPWQYKQLLCLLIANYEILTNPCCFLFSLLYLKCFTNILYQILADWHKVPSPHECLWDVWWKTKCTMKAQFAMSLLWGDA